ncbi:MAG: hypothetical protein WCJ33_05105 [Pseudomonadota bacterium]
MKKAEQLFNELTNLIQQEHFGIYIVGDLVEYCRNPNSATFSQRSAEKLESLGIIEENGFPSQETIDAVNLIATGEGANLQILDPSILEPDFFVSV